MSQRCLSGVLREKNRFKVNEVSANNARVLLFCIRDHLEIPGAVLIKKTSAILKEEYSFDVVKISGRAIKNCMLLVFENETIVENEKYVVIREKIGSITNWSSFVILL